MVCLGYSTRHIRRFIPVLANHYHLVPKNLIGTRFASDIFGDVKIALMGFCPPPSHLLSYAPERVYDQHFIHVSPGSVRLLKHQGRSFLSLSHVYGGPVASSTVEELAYYGIDYILAYGLAGGLSAGLAMGSYYLVEEAFVADGTTPHYTTSPTVKPDKELMRQIVDLWQATRPQALKCVSAATGDAIYREDDRMLEQFGDAGCDVVNLDSAHLYAVSRINSEARIIRTVQCGVVSDVIDSQLDGGSESTLSEMLSSSSSGGPNPLESTGDILSFYIEELAPKLPMT